MTKAEARRKVRRLIRKAQTQHEYGGGEVDGRLLSGKVKWEQLASRVDEVINSIKVERGEAAV